MATLVADLDLPFVSLDPSRPTPERTRHELAEDARWLFQCEMGYLMVGYDDVLALLRDHRWHSGLSRLAAVGGDEFEQWKAERQPGILQMNGEDHHRLRRILSPALTPKGADRLRPDMRRIVNDLLDPMLERGTGEFVSEVCEPYPIRVVFELLGLPAVLGDRFQALLASNQLTDINPAVDPDGVIAATERLDAFASDLVEHGRTEPRGRLMSVLIEAEAAGELSSAELVSLVESVLLAGTESTRSQLASTVTLFARFDEQFQLLRHRPELAASAVEEAMRYLGAVRGTARIASEDIAYRDVLFPRGTLVLAGFTAANRDRSVSANPNRFDIGNDGGRPQLTFGHGLHFCIGAALARAELQEAVLALAARVERVELAGAVEWRPQSADFWGPAVLPLAFH